jgi:NADP-dependent aldehyde dehydrogenase
VAGVEAEGHVSSPRLFAVPASRFKGDPVLSEEVFGAASLLVLCKDAAELAEVLRGLEGQLTVSVHSSAADGADAALLMPVIERLAGRVLFNGFGTGVEVCDAMVHGGPYPSTSDGRSTSVGSLAIMRFLRPVCYQDVPEELLPEAVRTANPLGIPQRIDGARSAV